MLDVKIQVFTLSDDGKIVRCIGGGFMNDDGGPDRKSVWAAV